MKKAAKKTTKKVAKKAKAKESFKTLSPASAFMDTYEKDIDNNGGCLIYLETVDVGKRTPISMKCAGGVTDLADALFCLMKDHNTFRIASMLALQEVMKNNKN